MMTAPPPTTMMVTAFKHGERGGRQFAICSSSTDAAAFCHIRTQKKKFLRVVASCLIIFVNVQYVSSSFLHYHHHHRNYDAVSSFKSNNSPTASIAIASKVVRQQQASLVSISDTPSKRRNKALALKATHVDLSDPITCSIFFLWGSPVPILFSSLIKDVEELELQQEQRRELEDSEDQDGYKKNEKQLQRREPSSSSTITTSPQKDPRNMLYAFPSFGAQMKYPPEPSCLLGPPGSLLDRSVRWFFALNVYAGIGWYLYYKYQIEEELKVRTGEGLGGAIVVFPFVAGLFLGIYGQVANGSLEGGLWDNIFSSAFWLGFLWIYIQQFILYEKVNSLYENKGLLKPLSTWGLLVPGYNFVTGIRQIHFLSLLWANEDSNNDPADAQKVVQTDDPFCSLFPFTTKPQLGIIELFTESDLWISSSGKEVLQRWTEQFVKFLDKPQQQKQ